MHQFSIAKRRSKVLNPWFGDSHPAEARKGPNRPHLFKTHSKSRNLTELHEA